MKEIVEVLVIGKVRNLVEMRSLVMSDRFPYLCWLFFTFFHLEGNWKCNLLNGCVMWDAGRVLEFVFYYFEDVQSEVTWGSSKEEERFLGLIFPSSCALTFPFFAETPLRLFGWLIFAREMTVSVQGFDEEVIRTWKKRIHSVQLNLFFNQQCWVNEFKNIPWIEWFGGVQLL